MLDEAAAHAQDLIAQGLDTTSAVEFAAIHFNVDEADVGAKLRAWRELPVEFDPPKDSTW